MTWSITASGGWPDIWTAPSNPAPGYTTAMLFCLCITGAISGNATFAVNIMDLSRHCKVDKSAWVGQLIALPVVVTLTEWLGACMAVASFVVYGTLQWNPLLVIYEFDNRAAKFFAAACFIFFNIMTNVTGNSVPFANDLTALFPKYINIRRGQFVCAIVSFAICPWQIEAKASSFLGFLSSYTILLGALTGVVMTDYFIIRRKGPINLYHLYKPHGIYWYNHGFNWRAFVAFFVSLAILFPGILWSCGVNITNQGILNLYSMNYLAVIAFSGSTYLALSMIFKPKVLFAEDDPGEAYLIEGIEPASATTPVEGGPFSDLEKSLHSKANLSTVV